MMLQTLLPITKKKKIKKRAAEGFYTGSRITLGDKLILTDNGGAKVTPVIEWTSPDNKIWTLREGVDYSLNSKNKVR